jgi:hypothetical protein
MKKIYGVLVFSLLFGCVTYAQDRFTYIQTNHVDSQEMNIANIDSFFQIINENRIKTVFYTDKQFIVQGNSLVYTIDKKGYNNLNDYKDGNAFFNDGNSYYLAKEVGLKNQQEVDYYKKEIFITISDYKDAVRLGFSPANSEVRGNMYGLISKENLQKNIRFANIAIYLQYYYSASQQSVANSRFNASSGASNNIELVGNTDVDYLITKSNGAIKKLNSYNYCIINLPVMTGKDSFLYYAAKMAQYTNYADYINNHGVYSVKNTDAILKQLGYNSIDDLVKADINDINNSIDYYLTVNYRITKNALEINRALIKEIETTKQRYNITILQAMMLNYVLKQPKGMPFSTRALITKFNQEYSNNTILNAQGRPTEQIFEQLFSAIPQLEKSIKYNPTGESLYVK